MERHALRGGGNREEVRDIVRGAGEAAKQLGSEVVRVGRHCYADSETKVVSEIKDDRAIRRKDDKFETEKVVLVDSSSEHESIVGWGCEIADEWLTRGARNEIHICDSNMNGSSEREVISRR